MIELSHPLIFALASALIFGVGWFVSYLRGRRLADRLAQSNSELTQALARADSAIKEATKSASAQLSEAMALIENERSRLVEEESRVRAHYESEARKFRSESETALQEARAHAKRLARFAELDNAEQETAKILEHAAAEAETLRREAAELLQAAQIAAKEERTAGSKRASELHAQADLLLEQAARKAAVIVEDAHHQAEKIAGAAYRALREREHLNEALSAVRNVIEGYGDRYVVPTRSVIDELAAGYGHTDAGRRLELARMQARKMVTESLAAACDYVESNRRETAVRFVTDAFNGRVDALLTEVGTENIGTLEQQIRDVFRIVNLNGEAFRNARILPAYLEARLEELRWAVATHELRQRERDEQRRIKEQIREEERARKEYERASRDAREEEAKLQRAIAKARADAEQSTTQDRLRLEQEISDLSLRLAEAEAKNQRALSMAQQTRKGNVYIISNVGSFGHDVFKIGMTRRLDPMDRIWELSDASVPFDFDVHALIACDDAPALESALHSAFEDSRVNRVNERKEFFQVSLEKIREIIVARGVEASFTLLAEAHEFRETQKLRTMSPEERERYASTRASTSRPTTNV